MKKILYSMFAFAMAAMTLTSCEDVPMPYDMPVVNPDNPGEEGDQYEGAAGTGTLEDPYNVMGALKMVSAMEGGVNSTEEYYIKGKVVNITAEYKNDQYGNATFYISDDVSDTEKSHWFYAYRCLYLGNTKFISGTNIKEGDEVILCGKVVNYSGNTPETVQNEAYLYSLNGETQGGGGAVAAIGSIDNPYSVTQALNVINALADNGVTAEDYYVAGKITQIKTTDANIAQYKNIDYVITDGTSEITVFRGKNLNNTDFTKAGEINVGDEVVVLGKLQKYVNNGSTTPEVAQGNYIVKYTAGSGGGTSSSALGSVDNPITITKALEIVNGLADNATSDQNVYVSGKITTIKTSESDIEKYKNIDYVISDGTNEITVFRGKNLNNTDFTKAGEINVGDEVVVYGKLQKYVKDGNTTPEVAQGNYIVKFITGGSGSGSGGSGSGSGSGDVTSSGDNGTFESWNGSTPTNWKTESTAGNATLSQSTDAHGGSYSVKVGGASSANKRLGYKEIQLSAGSYTLKFYAKAATSTGASVRPGYVPVTNGSVVSYVYGDYVNDITTNQWVEVTYTFEIASAGVYSIVIMNSKNPGGDVLIDDVTLTTGSTSVIK